MDVLTLPAHAKKQEARIRPLIPENQVSARDVILAGLQDHFGFLDDSLNPDLDNLVETYSAPNASFVVATIGDEVVGTGALVRESADTGRLVRMSVASLHRGHGIGRKLVEHLIGVAQRKGYTAVICETNHDWTDAIGLYRSCGFTEVGVWDGDRHFFRPVSLA